MTRQEDIHIGHRLRQRRRIVGMSQQDLAASVGVKFQQIQKYETGANRISGSRLYDIARSLRVPIGYFFEGLPDMPSNEDELRSSDESKLIRRYRASTETAKLSLLRISFETAQAAARA